MEFYCDRLPNFTIRTVTGNVFQQQQWGQLLIAGRPQGIKDEAGPLSRQLELAEEKTVNNRKIWKAENYGLWHELLFLDFPNKSQADWYRYVTVRELRSLLCQKADENKVYGQRIAILPLLWRHSDTIAAASIAAISSFVDLTLSLPRLNNLPSRRKTQFELYDLEDTGPFNTFLSKPAELRKFMQSLSVAQPNWTWAQTQLSS